jgi:hypothetical protein
VQPRRDVHQRDIEQGGTLQPRADRVHAEYRRGDQHGILLRTAQRTHQQIDGFITATADQELLRADAIKRGKRL